MKRLAAIAVLALAAPATAQESGWHYSPYPGEGDRAAMGCAYGSMPASHACIVVRCDDDFSIALYFDTTRMGGDAGRWTIEIDEATYPVAAAAVDGSPYRARVSEGDVPAIIDAIKNGDSLFLMPPDGAPIPNNGIGLSGSLYAINQALYFCAPRVDPNASPDQTTE
jgi:hypothetical protein